MNSFKLNSGLGLGDSYPIRVNCNFGINNLNDEQYEKNKIDFLFSQEKYLPDLAMDLSTIQTDKPICDYIISNYNIPVGTVPVYLSFKEEIGINKTHLLEVINKQADYGVSFLTLHFTADFELFQRATKTRKIPVTSRGGGLVLLDQIIKKNHKNILLEHIDEIIKICKKRNIAISVGTTFRPASIIDACDEIHLQETKMQLEIVRYLKKEGINTIVENVGHISIDRISKHVKLLKEFNSPIMPLGPMPTDIALDNDHIAASIGAAFLSYWGGAHIINSITPNEHTVSYIDMEATKKGIEAAKIASHIINLTKNQQAWMKEQVVYNTRAVNRNCLNEKDKCNRCSNQCPLTNL